MGCPRGHLPIAWTSQRQPHQVMQVRATENYRPRKGEEKKKRGLGSVGLATDVRSELEENQRARDVLYIPTNILYRKKVRCTGRCPCALCLKSGLPCEFTASYTRGRLPSVIVDEAAMAMDPQPQVRREISISESSAAGEPATSAVQYPRIYPSPSSPMDPPTYTHANNADPSTLNMTTEYTNRPPTRDSPVPQGGQRDQEGHYVGSSSAVSFLIRIQRRLHQSSSLSHDSTIFTFGDAPLPEYDQSLFFLPPKSDAQRLVERYFDYAAPTHRFLHRPSIEKLLDEFYDTLGEIRGREDGKAKAALLMVVFAQAQAYMPPGSTVQENR
jgi:hypothetical protein